MEQQGQSLTVLKEDQRIERVRKERWLNLRATDQLRHSRCY